MYLPLWILACVATAAFGWELVMFFRSVVRNRRWEKECAEQPNKLGQPDQKELQITSILGVVLSSLPTLLRNQIDGQITPLHRAQLNCLHALLNKESLDQFDLDSLLNLSLKYGREFECRRLKKLQEKSASKEHPEVEL